MIKNSIISPSIRWIFKPNFIFQWSKSRRLSHDGAVGSPYSTAPSSCRNLNLRFAVKTATFMRDRQIFSPFLKFVFIFWEGELFKPNCLTSLNESLYCIRLWKQLDKWTRMCTSVRLSQINKSRITTGSIWKRNQTTIASPSFVSTGRAFISLFIHTVSCFDRLQCWLNS